MATDIWEVPLAKQIREELGSDEQLTVWCDIDKKKELRVSLKGLKELHLFSILDTGCIKANVRHISKGLVNLGLKPDKANDLATNYVQSLDQIPEFKLKPESVKVSTMPAHRHLPAAKHTDLHDDFEEFAKLVRDFASKVIQAQKASSTRIQSGAHPNPKTQ